MSTRIYLWLAVLWIGFGLVGCSTTSKPSSTSSRLPVWHAAERKFSAGHYDQTIKHIDQLTELGGPVAERATAWKLCLLSGLSRGFLQLSEAYASGSEQNGELVPFFRRSKTSYEGRSRVYTLALAEMAMRLEGKLGESDSVVLDFPFPEGSTAAVSVVAYISEGRRVQEREVETAEFYSLRRAVLLALSEATGRGGVEASRQVFEERPVNVPKPTFLAFVGKVLYEQADLFSERRLNDVRKREALLTASNRLLESARASQSLLTQKLDSWSIELAERGSLE